MPNFVVVDIPDTPALGGDASITAPIYYITAATAADALNAIATKTKFVNPRTWFVAQDTSFTRFVTTPVWSVGSAPG